MHTRSLSAPGSRVLLVMSNKKAKMTTKVKAKMTTKVKAKMTTKVALKQTMMIFTIHVLIA
jgi:hypothetical protein